MIVYGLDTAILLFIGRVPLAYNVRNLIVRWRISVLTAIVFTAVVGLLTGLLAFVNGMYALAADSGQPGNVLCWPGPKRRSRLESRLQRRGNDRRQTATLDADDRPLPRPVRVKRINLAGREQPMASKEIYCIVNRPIENDPTRRQFVQVRGILDPVMAGMVHDLSLLSGEWFSDAGVRTPAGARPGDRDQIEAVLAPASPASWGNCKARNR